MTDSPTPEQGLSAPTPARTAGVCALFVAGLLALIGLVVAFGQPPWRHSSVWLPLTFGACSAAPFVVVGVALSREPRSWAVGASSMLAWLTMLTSFAVTIGGFLILILLLVGTGAALLPLFSALASETESLSHVMTGGAYVLLTVVFALCVVIVVNTRRARRQLTPNRQRGLGTGRLLALGYAAVGIPWFVRTSHEQQEQDVATIMKQEKDYRAFGTKTQQALHRMQSCLYSYEQAHGGEGFPTQLNAILPSGSGCLDASTLQSLVEQANFRYFAPRDSAGHRSSFWIVAEPRSKSSALAKTYYADENGLIYEARIRTQYHPNGTYETPAAPLPPSDRSVFDNFESVSSPAYELAHLRQCFQQVYRDEKRLYPLRLLHSTCWLNDRGTRGDTLLFPVEDGTYKFVYHPHRAVNDSSARGFDIDMRPDTYAVDGVRSYWMDESGEIHWTREDRSARRTDPRLGNCTLSQRCSD